jgi:valyl-tRNA synthetase
MEKVYKHQLVERKWYDFWEKSGYFTPHFQKKKKTFCIILPPPNANADLHLGHAMYTVEDILVRYYRMIGFSTLWLPGADHAGFETQYVYEKKLQKEGKSRFQFDNETLYKKIWDFVEENRGNMENQLKRLGFSLDWTRKVFTLNPKVVKIVYKTFKKLYDDGLLYRSKRLVNYCTKCGTGFSDLEVKYIEEKTPLYYLKYGPFILATTRPETKFGDTAVAVNPKDKRYKKWIGKEIEVSGLTGKFKLKVIADEMVDPNFGTGVVKITPAHDPNDFEVGKRHNLPLKQIIGFDGKLTKETGPYAGLKVKAAREKAVEDLGKKGLIERIDKLYTHTIGTCYKCTTSIEPLPLAQWYIKIKPLKENAIKAINSRKITFAPAKFKKNALLWLNNFHDWNISRQIIWGIRIPAWKCINCDKNNDNWIVTDGNRPDKCPKCNKNHLTQDPDTFDTWFSSGQWPFATLLVNSQKDFEYFYPTSIMETGYDILPWWVCRMIMLGIYTTGKIPFKTVCLHGLVRDSKGQKMSKSKGNVINPITMVDLYGADSLRMALVYGTAFGNDVPMSEDKVRGMRNFSNKLFNIGRFIKMNIENYSKNQISWKTFVLEKDREKLNKNNKKILTQLGMLERRVTVSIENCNFDKAANALYGFLWHTLADKYLENSKENLKQNDPQTLAVLLFVFKKCLIFLHPFMPFITEELNSILYPQDKPLIITNWSN